jgi:hypothetical protein
MTMESALMPFIYPLENAGDSKQFRKYIDALR